MGKTHTKAVFFCREDGLLECRSPKQAGWVIANAGKPVAVSLSSDPRSDIQNRYYWGWIIKNQVNYLTESGISLRGIPYTKDLLHAMYRELFLIDSSTVINGKEVKIYKSTTDMSKKRFIEYIDNEIQPWFNSAFGYIVPPTPAEENYWHSIEKEVRT